MKLSDLLAMCVRNLIRRKFRTFLTVMGVVIGTTSIIMMISLGIGISAQQEAQIAMWGDLTMINVFWQGNDDIPLNADSVEQFLGLPGVVAASPMQYFDFSNNDDGAKIEVFAGKRDVYRNQWPSMMYVYPEALIPLGFEIAEGETLPSEQQKTVKCVIGSQTAYEFQDTRKRVNNQIYAWPDEVTGEIPEPYFEPLGAELKLRLTPNSDPDAQPYEVTMEVVGVLTEQQNKGESMYGIFVGIEDAMDIKAGYDKQNDVNRRDKEGDRFDSVSVKVDDIDNVAGIQQQITDAGYGTWSMDERRQEMQQSMRQMQIILGSLGAISLLVSAISITNTMIMSVYERTREIGVMKVLGCLVGNIRSVFLMEAGAIGFFGGIIGVTLSFLLSAVLNIFGGGLISGGGGGMLGMMGRYGRGMAEEGGKISIIPLWLVLLGMAFATMIGLVAGFYPANRAVRISALEAIKQE